MSETTFDVFAVLDPEQFKRLADMELLVSVLHSSTSEQIARRGLTPEQFAEGFDGNSLELARDALAEAIADFFPSRQQAILRAMLAKEREIRDLATTKAVEVVNGLDASAILAQISRDSALSPPASSESIQEPSASAS